MPRILIVEDERTVRNLLCDLLGPSHECVAVGSAEEGLVILRTERFDAAITDVALQGMDGEAFLRRARELAPSLPVIVLTGADSDERKFLEAGAFGYLLKPFRFGELEEIVGRAVGA